MSVEKRRIVVLVHDVEIRLYDMRFGTCAGRTFQEGDHDELFVMEFFGLVHDETLVHECWHCIFRILHRCDINQHQFRELMDEIYAYTFSDFFSTVKDRIQRMKLYKRIWESKDDTSGED